MWHGLTADAAIDRAVAARAALSDVTNTPDATPDSKTPLQAKTPLLSTAERRAARAHAKGHAASPAAAFRAWLGNSPLICLSDSDASCLSYSDASSDSDPDSDFASPAIRVKQEPHWQIRTPPQTQESPEHKRARNRRV